VKGPICGSLTRYHNELLGLGLANIQKPINGSCREKSNCFDEENFFPVDVELFFND